MSFVTAGTSVAVSPLFMDVEFPLEAWYPFSTQPLLLKIFIYVTHLFTISYTVTCLNVDIMIVILIFYCTVKLEVLACEVRQATDNNDIIVCIRKHQEIIE